MVDVIDIVVDGIGIVVDGIGIVVDVIGIWVDVIGVGVDVIGIVVDVIDIWVDVIGVGVSGHDDKSVRVWDATTGVPLVGTADCSGILLTSPEGFVKQSQIRANETTSESDMMEVESVLMEEDVKKRMGYA
eukprot:4698203-Pyramimonas_sp.AAC.1